MKISTTKSDNTKYKLKIWEVWNDAWTQFKVISYENGIQINWSKTSFEESSTYNVFKEKYGNDSIVFKSNTLKINDKVIKAPTKLTIETLKDFLSIYYGTLLYFEIK
jgi:hypothetical protein